MHASALHHPDGVLCSPFWALRASFTVDVIKLPTQGALMGPRLRTSAPWHLLVPSVGLIFMVVTGNACGVACFADQEVSRPQNETLQYLRELATRKSAVRHQLATLPEKINEETAAIMKALDAFWASERAAGLHEAFIEKATAQAADIHLDDQYSTLGTIWAEYKSLASEDLLVEMTKSYVNKIHAGIKVDQDRLSEALQNEMTKELDPVFNKAQRSLAETFDGAIQSQFQFWQQCFVKFPPVVSENPDLDVPGGAGPGRRFKTIAGIILILMGRLVGSLVRKIIARVTRTVFTKLTAKVAGKFIPLIGLLLLAWDFVDAARARANFETVVRTEFLQELAKETTPEKLWLEKEGDEPSMREEVETMVRSQLTEWTALAREQADSFLDAASLADNPAFEAFVVQFEQERTRFLQEDPDAAAARLSFFIDRCGAMHDAFGPICQTVASFDTLEEMLLLSKDRTALKLLVDAMGIDAVNLFEKHGKAVIEASAVLTPPVLAKLVADGKDWQGRAVEYRRILGSSPTPAMRQGLALAIDSGFDLNTLGNPELLARFGQHAEVFQQLCKGGVSPARISDCLSRDQAAAFLDAIASKSPELLLPLANELEPVRLQRLMAENYVEPVAATWSISKSLGYDAKRFTDVIRDSEELFEAYKSHAEKGTEIYLSYVKDGGGALQRQNARTAVGLYGMNCPVEVCLDRDNLGMTSFFYGFPGGPQLYKVIYRVNSFFPYLGWILGLVIVVAPPYLIARWLGFFNSKRRRSTNRSMTRGRSPVDITVKPQRDSGNSQSRQPLPGKPVAIDAPLPPDSSST